MVIAAIIVAVTIAIVAATAFWPRQAWSLRRQDASIIKSDLSVCKKW